ncbi:hypothetical protein Aperf_G00000021693 [Anoplocephala perfoliata]
MSKVNEIQFNFTVRPPKAEQPAQSAVAPIIMAGAARGSRRVLAAVPLSARSQYSLPQRTRSKARQSTSASLRNSIVAVDSKSENDSRVGTLRRIHSSTELRDFVFRSWCANRGKRYLEERKQEQARQLRAEEESKKLKAEKAKQNEEIFALWLAKKREQDAAVRKKRLKEEEEKRHEEESRKQLKTEAERAFEAWKSKKDKQLVRRHSVSVMNREKMVEELNAKLERATAAHVAFEAWEKQVNQRLQETREREVAKAREEEKRKAEMEAMRREIARTSYTQWELRKAVKAQSTKNVSAKQRLIARPPWRPTSARVILP